MKDRFVSDRNDDDYNYRRESRRRSSSSLDRRSNRRNEWWANELVCKHKISLSIHFQEPQPFPLTIAFAKPRQTPAIYLSQVLQEHQRFSWKPQIWFGQTQALPSEWPHGRFGAWPLLLKLFLDYNLFGKLTYFNTYY